MKSNLYDKIINSISKEIKKVLNENNVRQNYFIKIFKPLENEDDKQFIKTNALEILTFFKNGYKAAGLIDFLSCINKESLRKNTNLLKIAYIEHEPIAMSIYSGRTGGYKCVGITATTNEEYREIGKKAAKEIIAYDMKNYNSYYWIECDMRIKKMCESRGGIPIPNEYAYLLDDKLHPDINDDYKCYITLADEEYEKYIFGFNSKETYDEIVNKNDERILKYIQKTDTCIYESAEIQYDNIDKAIRIINILYDERCEVSGCFSKQILNILKNNVNILEKYVDKNIEDKRMQNIELAIENGYDIIDSSTLLELHKF